MLNSFVAGAWLAASMPMLIHVRGDGEWARMAECIQDNPKNREGNAF